jgi:hypothetical protein
MSVRRRVTALIGVGIVLVFVAHRPLAAQTLSMSITRDGDSIPAAPQVTVASSGVPAGTGATTIRLEVARDAAFQSTFIVDAKLTDLAIFALPRLLPERTVVFFRATLIDQTGQSITATTASFPVRTWLRLISPNRLTNLLFTRRPQFVWNVSSLTLPPGPWSFDISVVNVGTNQVDFFVPLGVSDTAFVFPQDLESNTSYKWRVRARAVNSSVNDEVTVTSQGTFVIQSSDQPTSTIFYQNFPNPFPTARSAVTCFWFDLAERATVRLTIYDLRLREVKNIIPGALGSNLPAGAYGRPSDQTQSCDNRIIWDGTDDRGRVVPRGVYLARFQAGSVSETKKILFVGR